MSKATELADRLLRPNSGPWDNLDAAYELRRLAVLNQELVEALDSIASFAVGYGDVCEIIASRARAALAKAGEMK